MFLVSTLLKIQKENFILRLVALLMHDGPLLPKNKFFQNSVFNLNFQNFSFFHELTYLEVRYILDFIFLKSFNNITTGLSRFKLALPFKYKKRPFYKQKKNRFVNTRISNSARSKVRRKHNTNAGDCIYFLLPVDIASKCFFSRVLARFNGSMRVWQNYKYSKFESVKLKKNLLRKRLTRFKSSFLSLNSKEFFKLNYIRYIKSVIRDTEVLFTPYNEFDFLSNFKYLVHLFTNFHVLHALVNANNFCIWQNFVDCTLALPPFLAEKFSYLNSTFVCNSLIDVNTKFLKKKFSSTLNHFLNHFFIQTFSKIYKSNFILYFNKNFNPDIQLCEDSYFHCDLKTLLTPYYSSAMNEHTMRLIFFSFKYCSSELLIKCILILLSRRPVWEHPRILHYVKTALDYAFYNFKFPNFSGLYIVVRGKIGVTGSVRKRQFLYSCGKMSYTNVTLRSSFTRSTICTKTGVMGATAIIFYEQ